jgi:hypothetical protein
MVFGAHFVCPLVRSWIEYSRMPVSVFRRVLIWCLWARFTMATWVIGLPVSVWCAWAAWSSGSHSFVSLFSISSLVWSGFIWVPHSHCVVFVVA